MLQSFELVNVERLEADELVSGDQGYLLSTVHASMSVNRYSLARLKYGFTITSLRVLLSFSYGWLSGLSKAAGNM